MLIRNLTLIILFAPLLGAIVAGFGAKKIGKFGAHVVTISLMLLSLICAILVFKDVAVLHHSGYYGNIYTWGVGGHFRFNMGFMIDSLTATMMLVVTFIATLVHIYSIGYMVDDIGNQRFFCYMSFFTFAMLLLVSANNFFQLFVGWEGVGLVSYLLISFYYNKESAAIGGNKAFWVNRVGDFGFIIGLAAILCYTGSLDYHTVFHSVHNLTGLTITIFGGVPWHIITFICVCLFIGAMGKSAQMPLHIWLPESMEGPTPISALIHAATMVTAGVFLVARMSPLFEYSLPALEMVLIVGASTALYTGILAFVEFDIKRVIAFSTMSQLGYMMAADGVSAFSAGIFHLLTHACFKALLFISAGSVIIAMHHEQDMRKMGNLKKYLPITYVTFLVGALALAAIPPFSGFYSKDSIIDAVGRSIVPGHTYAYVCLVLGAFVTGYYIFRAFFMTFHSTERISPELRAKLREPHPAMYLTQIVLAVPAAVIGGIMIYWILYAHPSLIGNSVFVLPKYNVLTQMAKGFHGAGVMLGHAFVDPAFYAAFGGVFFAWLNVIVIPQFPEFLQRHLPWLHRFLVNQYGFDTFNNIVFVKGTRFLGQLFYKRGDVNFVDNLMIEGSARGASFLGRLVRRLQSGYLYQYAFLTILVVLAFIIWLVLV